MWLNFESLNNYNFVIYRSLNCSNFKGSDCQPACHVNAECRSNFLFYLCICKPGYSGNGYRCNGKLIVFSRYRETTISEGFSNKM